MTTTTHLQQTLEQVLRHLVSARSAASGDAALVEALHEVELTLYEVCDLPTESEPTTAGPGVHEALIAAETVLDGLPRAERPLWLLPLRAEVAILRRRSTS